MDEIFEIENNEKTGKEFLKTFLSELISNFKEKNISSKKLMVLSKALYIVENFRKVKFDGIIRIEAGYKIENGGANYYVMSICCEEVILCQSGFEYTEGVGSDSVYYEMFYLGEQESYIDATQKLDEWLDAFNELSIDGTDFTTSDDIEKLEEVEKDYDEE